MDLLRVAGVAGWLLALAPLAGAAAQPGTPSRERAEALHREGLAALEELHFARARDLFAESLRAYPSLGTAFNLGLAYRGTGEAHAAIETFERVLSNELGTLSDEQRVQVETLLREVRSEVTHLRIRLLEPSVAELSIDGEERGELRVDSARSFELDPGRRVLSVSASGHETSVRTVTLVPGAHETVELTLEPLPSAGGVGVFEHPAFWTVVALVVLAGGGIGLYFATGPHFAAPIESRPFGVVTTLLEW